MGTWICHLRIAENLLPHLPEIDPITFTFGNLAPDSGIPNEDWTEFDPPKEVTHFLNKGEGEGYIRDLVYYREYLANLEADKNLQKYSFRLGYFTHLICDVLWYYYLDDTMQAGYRELIEKDASKAWGLFKKDWYSLDQQYNQIHKEGLFWKVIFLNPNPPSFLPFVRENALHQQYDYIRKFYSEYDPYWFEERTFPYLNAATMDRLVEDMTQATLFILENIKNAKHQDLQSSFQLLPQAMQRPYEMPLGDV